MCLIAHGARRGGKQNNMKNYIFGSEVMTFEGMIFFSECSCEQYVVCNALVKKTRLSS
jgi:hypothetical protein